MKRYNINWTAKTLYNQIEKGNVNFNCSVQRGLAWDNERNSLLIHSMVYGYAIPAMYFVKNENGSYDALDGKQRSTSIHDFLEGAYPLHENTPTVCNDEEGAEEEDISGCFFENLSEWCKDAIKDYSLTIYYYEDMTEDEIREFFRRLNNGKPLTAIELTRVKAKSIDAFQRLASHDVVMEAVSSKGKERYTDELISMQIYAMDKMETLDFGNKAFRPWVQNEVVSTETETDILNGLNYVKALFDSLVKAMEANPDSKEDKRVNKKIHTRTNFVSIAYAGLLAAKDGVNEAEFVTAVYKFFDCATTSTDTDYNTSVGAGSARAENVQKRKTAMQNLVQGIEG